MSKTASKKLVVKSALRVIRLDTEPLNVDPSYQRDIKPRHKNIVAEFNEEAFGIPLIGERDDGSLYIVDGLQRITAKKILGHKELRAEVFHSDGPEHEAGVFKLVNMNRTKLSAGEEFRCLLTCHDEAAWEIQNAAESCGFKIVLGKSGKGDSDEMKAKQLTCVNTLRQIQRDYSTDQLIFALQTIAQCWPADRLGTNSKVILGLAVWHNRYDGIVDNDRLVNRLSTTTPYRVLYTANQSYIGSGGGGIAFAVSDVIERLFRKRAAKTK